MARFVVIGLPGEEGLWLADLDAGTVTALAPPTTGGLRQANDLRAAGVTVIKNVDLAVGVDSAGDVAGGFLA